MKIQQETTDLLEVLIVNWSKLCDYYFKKTRSMSYEGDTIYTVIGQLDWDNPNIAWLLATGGGEGYEGWATQIGLTKDGRLVWEYQSHCSCNSFGDSSDKGNEMPEDTSKIYEFKEVPSDWESEIRENARKIIKELNLSYPHYDKGTTN